MSKLPSRILAPCLIVAILAITALSQSSTATLSGTVADPNGAAIPGAQITITRPATGFESSATTNASGYFTVPLLPPGEYTVMARANGFAAVQIPAVILNVGDQKSLQIGMKVG